jgi:hypothetical protein
MYTVSLSMSSILGSALFTYYKTPVFLETVVVVCERIKRVKYSEVMIR